MVHIWKIIDKNIIECNKNFGNFVESLEFLNEKDKIGL